MSDSKNVPTERVKDDEKNFSRRIIKLLTQWEFILFLLFILVVIFNSFLSPYFLDYFNIMNTTFNFMEKAIIALSMVFIILVADIDISVAGIIALSSLFMGMASYHGAGTGTLIVIGLMVGILAGLLNGLIITKFNIPAIAVTIGSMSLFRGIAYAVLGDKAYTKYPKSFSYFGQGYIPGTVIPFELVLFVVLAIIFSFMLHRTSFGRKLYAAGNNPVASRFSGIKVNRIRLFLFSLNGFMSGIAAILLTSRIGSTRPNIANGWELEIITTVVLGGIAITGGKGKMLGVIIGIFLIGFLKFGMGLVNIPGKVMNIVVGFLLIIAIMLPDFIGKLRKNYILKQERA